MRLDLSRRKNTKRLQRPTRGLEYARFAQAKPSVTSRCKLIATSPAGFAKRRHYPELEMWPQGRSLPPHLPQGRSLPHSSHKSAPYLVSSRISDGQAILVIETSKKIVESEKNNVAGAIRDTQKANRARPYGRAGGVGGGGT